MARKGTSVLTARPGLAVVLRYCLAVCLVAIALVVTLATHLHNSPTRFVSHFVLLAIAVTFWCGGTGPGLFALLLSCVGVSLMARNHLLTPDFPLAQFLIFFIIFSFLFSLFSASRRRAQRLLIDAHDNLELRVAERTDELARANNELQNTQAELESRERYLAEAQRLSHTGSIGWEVSTGEVLWSDETYRILGYARETKPTLELVLNRIHPQDRDRTREILERAARNGIDLDFEHRFLMPDGSIKNIHTVAHAVSDDSGNLRYIGAAKDITDRTQAEEALRRSERDLSLTIETIPGLVWCASPEGDLTYMNQRIVDFLGKSPSELPPGGWSDFVHPDDCGARQTAWNQAVATGRPYEMQLRLRGSDGVHRWFHSLSRLGRDDEGRASRWYGLLIDIDDRKNMEEALHNSETRLSRATRTATVGEFAASIAHEINQPLAAVVTNAEACLRWLSAHPPDLAKVYQTAEKIACDGMAAGEVVRRIRALFRQAPLEKTELDLNEVISEVLRLLGGETAKKRIAVEMDLEKNLPSVVADRVQLQQLIFNLVLNGIEAMEPVLDRPKKLFIRSKRHDSKAVLVEVQDCGVGLEDTERVFEAFFTTKTMGMGMGLAVCRSIIDAHQGRLWAMSDEGAGTTFSFILPL